MKQEELLFQQKLTEHLAKGLLKLGIKSNFFRILSHFELSVFTFVINIT